MELAAHEPGGEAGERFVERREVGPERLGENGFDHEALAARRRAFDHHAGGLAGELAVAQDGLGQRVGLVDPRPAERPAGAGGHVDAQAEAPRLRAPTCSSISIHSGDRKSM